MIIEQLFLTYHSQEQVQIAYKLGTVTYKLGTVTYFSSQFYFVHRFQPAFIEYIAPSPGKQAATSIIDSTIRANPGSVLF